MNKGNYLLLKTLCLICLPVSIFLWYTGGFIRAFQFASIFYYILEINMSLLRHHETNVIYLFHYNVWFYGKLSKIDESFLQEVSD